MSKTCKEFNEVKDVVMPDTDAPLEEHMFAVREETERRSYFCGHLQEIVFCEVDVRSGFRSHPRTV